MPSLMSEQRLHHHICLGLSTLLLSSALIGCGSGESEARKSTPPEEVVAQKPKNFNIKVPLEIREVVVKVFDNVDDRLVLEQNFSTTTDLSITLPEILNKNRLYRVELTTTPNSLIYDFLSGQYKKIDLTLRALVKVDVSDLTQTIFINPSSESIYQRALVRSGQLPSDESNYAMNITAGQLELATSDVETALLSAFKYLNITNVNPSNRLHVFSPQSSNINSGLYLNTYLSFGYLQQWSTIYPDTSFAEFSKNLAIDLRDGYLDAKKIRGDQEALTTLVLAAPDNIDPAKNTIIDIANNQKNTREQYAASLKQAVLQLADTYDQKTSNPTHYNQLQQRSYSGVVPTANPSVPHNVRITGAGDYRRAVGFSDTIATCNGSIYPCKQGITGINIINHSSPSIEYLIGHYQDNSQGCQLDIRADGWLELTKNNQTFRSKLDGDSTDNLLQVNKENHEYLLNSSSPEPTNSNSQYQFVQVNIKANQVLSASAGFDTRKAPDQLQSTQLQCSFSS
ncbi:hypothetical protein MMO38_03100 [Acinetobacter sp. NIPH 1852]|uniref:hypothetical protein n=1 Tax=Acinetobacter sp. NIPH 1852 TaxID=2923428 RepID=UPI001B412311|nr:hypothetical protein [Acinetobacter sp. NIPH 1852]MBP7880638.1 hypothetical protein [Acinetobacter sp.]MCH7307132.1 hypothetical protein [Acinetobacter sp. NIPH 1852]